MLSTDTPVSGYRWGVTLYDRYPATGVSVGNYHIYNQIDVTTDTRNLKGLNIFFDRLRQFPTRPTREFVLPNTNSRVGLHDILLWGDKPKGLKAALLGETKV